MFCIVCLFALFRRPILLVKRIWKKENKTKLGIELLLLRNIPLKCFCFHLSTAGHLINKMNLV